MSPIRIVGPLVEAAVWLIAWTLPPAERKSVHAKGEAPS